MTIDLEKLVLGTVTQMNQIAAQAYAAPPVFTEEELRQEQEINKAIEDAEMYASRPSRRLRDTLGEF